MGKVVTLFSGYLSNGLVNAKENKVSSICAILVSIYRSLAMIGQEAQSIRSDITI